MNSLALKDFEIREEYFSLIYNQMMQDLIDTLYLPLYKLANIQLPKYEAINALTKKEAVADALKKGKIYYDDGVFRAANKFNSLIARALEDLGATYNKRLKGFILPSYKLPSNLTQLIASQAEQTRLNLQQIDGFLQDYFRNIDATIETFVYNDSVKKILKDAQGQIQKNTKTLNVIEPDLSEKQLNELSRTYTNNMNLYIKDWLEQDISEMREKVQALTLSGARQSQVQQLLEQEYGIGQKKAKFLAHQETSILLAEYKSTTYQEMGFNQFIWKTILDGRERELHKQYNNRIFSFKNKPIIDERTNARGLPGEAFGCRCSLIPYREDNIFMSSTRVEGRKYSFI